LFSSLSTSSFAEPATPDLGPSCEGKQLLKGLMA